MNRKNLFSTIIVMVVVILGIATIMHCCKKQTEPTIVTEIHTSDTIVKRQVDSIFIPTYYHLPGKIDTVFVFNNTDTVIIQGFAYDTIYIENLDIQLVTHDTIIRDTFIQQIVYKEPKKHWGVGINAGVGGSYGLIHKQFDVGPYVGVGLIYRF